MEASFSWSEFDRAAVRPNLEDAAAVLTVISDFEFLLVHNSSNQINESEDSLIQNEPEEENSKINFETIHSV